MKTIGSGSSAPDFTLPDETGTPRKLSDFLAKGPVVLFFYPGAMTSGCTAESCRFRDLAAEFDAVGAQRIGISADTVDKQRVILRGTQLPTTPCSPTPNERWPPRTG